MWLAVLFLSLLCVGNGVAVYLLWRDKQRLTALYAEYAEQASAQKKALNTLNRRLETYLSGSMRMGQELDEIQQSLTPLSEKILRMEQKDPNTLSFTQAARLVGLGATTEDLKQSCGLSQSEAELLQRLHAKR